MYYVSLISLASIAELEWARGSVAAEVTCVLCTQMVEGFGGILSQNNFEIWMV